LFLLFGVFIISCNKQIEDNNIEKENKIENKVVNMKLTSPAFEHNKEMPSEYTCDSNDLSPELNIEDIPKNAKSLVLIMDDPDAPMRTWDHWIVFNIGPNTKTINKGEEPNGIGGKNSWGRTGYGGPCPPSGTHRYFFKLYALDSTLSLEEGTSKNVIENAIEKHIIEKTELIGVYKRK